MLAEGPAFLPPPQRRGVSCREKDERKARICAGVRKILFYGSIREVEDRFPAYSVSDQRRI